MTVKGNGILKAERHREIEQLLRAHPVTSQIELARLLRARGIDVTQATLSRDLEEIGAFKARVPGGSSGYRLPDTAPGGPDRLSRMLREFAAGFEATGNLVVVHTPPGGAGAVARAIDGATLPGVLGTVAGDDTIIIVCGVCTAGSKLVSTLRELAHVSVRPA